MKTDYRLRFTGCFIFLSFFLSGCASFSGLRYYTGEVFPREEVAFIYLARHCQIGEITRQGQEKIKLLCWSETNGEILPGSYTLVVRYYSGGTYSKTIGNDMPIAFTAKAGHVYYIKPEFLSSNRWQPVVIDIADDQDYSQIADRDPDAIKQRVEKYFQGDRSPISPHEYKTRTGGTVKLWR